MTRSIVTTAGACLAVVSSLSIAAEAPLAAAQPAPPAYATAQPAPPYGDYAAPPPGASAYDQRQQEADRAYSEAYSRWAAQYCVDERNSNIAAGAIIGGLLGAGVGAALGRGTGAAVGGVLGAGTGAAVGASTATAGCPPGYVVRTGAPAFAYGGPYYDPGVTYTPGWYRPWVWADSHWVYYPYRYWYWNHPTYWQPGWSHRPWRYHYRRW